ncbi:MAG: glycosyl transferase family 1, partial [Gemmatimonadaceae bacterium]
MRLLFVHQNFPGQYRHIAAHYARHGHQVVGVGESANLARTVRLPGVRLLGYDAPAAVEGKEGPVARAIGRGKRVAAGCTQLRRSGFVPDVVFAHIGWGEALFLKDVFPEARVVLYCEYFYRGRGGDFGFDPEFPATPEKLLQLRVMNAPLLMALDASDVGIAPTRWQQSRFPAVYRPRIDVIHEGIDTNLVAPRGAPDEELVTYVSRNLEPYRGFHTLMRAIPEIQRGRPKARIVIVGGDEVSYSPRLPKGQT